MITKDRLLAGLNEVIYVEEGMIAMYANFSKALVAHTENIDEKKRNKMVKLLTRLYKDSSRHKDTIDKMIKEVEEGIINEY